MTLPFKAPAPRIDKKDSLILQSLITNCRTTLTTLSRITNLSKNSVANRIAGFEREGIINGYLTLVRIHKIGWTMYTIGVKTSMSITEKKKYIESLRHIHFLNNIVTMPSSNWDLLLRIYARDNQHLHELITKITSHPHIQDIDVRELDDWHYTTPDFFSIKLNLNTFVHREDPSFHKSFSRPRIGNTLLPDLKDKEILHTLSTNARMPLTEVGHRTGLSADAVAYRVRNLIRTGAIQCFFPSYNPYHFGYIPHCLTLKVFNRSKIRAIADFITTTSCCTGLLVYKGAWNIQAFVWFRDLDELTTFEERLLTQFEQAIHEHEITQPREQPLFRPFPNEFVHDRA